MGSTLTKRYKINYITFTYLLDCYIGDLITITKNTFSCNGYESICLRNCITHELNINEWEQFKHRWATRVH